MQFLIKKIILVKFLNLLLLLIKKNISHNIMKPTEKLHLPENMRESKQNSKTASQTSIYKPSSGSPKGFEIRIEHAEGKKNILKIAKTSKNA